MTVNEIITTCHKINTKPNIHLGEVQDVYGSKDGQMRYYTIKEVLNDDQRCSIHTET